VFEPRTPVPAGRGRPRKAAREDGAWTTRSGPPRSATSRGPSRPRLVNPTRSRASNPPAREELAVTEVPVGDQRLYIHDHGADDPREVRAPKGATAASDAVLVRDVGARLRSISGAMKKALG
jgi:hypothetical protein